MKTITQEQYLQLKGLEVLGRRLVRQVDEIIQAAGEIAGEAEPNGGYMGDMMYGSRELDDALKILKVEVADPGPTQKEGE